VVSGFQNFNIWCESQVLASKCNTKLLSNYKFLELKSIKVNYTKKHMLLQHPTIKFNIQVISVVGIGRRKWQSCLVGQCSSRPKKQVDSKFLVQANINLEVLGTYRENDKSIP